MFITKLAHQGRTITPVMVRAHVTTVNTLQPGCITGSKEFVNLIAKGLSQRVAQEEHKRFNRFCIGLSDIDPPAVLVQKLSDGDEYSSRVLEYLAEECSKIDPHTHSGNTFLAYSILFDKLGIEGRNIFLLYNKSGDTLLSFMTILRAYTLGIIDERFIYDLILVDEPLSKNQLDAILALVQKELPDFNNYDKVSTKE